MSLVSMTSDLTSLKFGRDRRGGGKSGQPFVTERIPQRDRSINFANSFLGNDFLIRGGVTSVKAVLQDELRLTKFLTSLRSPNGFLFITKQQMLSQQNPLTGAAPSRIYLPSNTLAQAGVNPIGKHFVKQGMKLVLDDDEKYFKLTKDRYNTPDTNKLLLLHQTKLSTPPLGLDLPIPLSDLPGSLFQNPKAFFQSALNNLTSNLSAFALSVKDAAIPPQVANNFENNLNRFGISQDPNVLFSYQGGPNSSIGTKTVIRKVFNTNEGAELNKVNSPINQFLTYTPDLLVNKARIGNSGTSFGTTGIRNFEQDLINKSETGVSDERKNQLIGEPTDYTVFNRSKTYGESDPGATKRNRSVYYSTNLKPGLSKEEINNIYAPDAVNAQPLYSTTNKSANKGEGYDDIIKFNIGVLDLDSTGETRNTTWIHFKAALESFTDSYKGTWNTIKYMGRGNNFYKYDGYTRDINMDFKVVVHSKYEQAIIYDKLNYLASAIAPNYSSGGFMRGNLIKLTIGDYLNNTIGILNGFNYSIAQDTPWDIGRKGGLEGDAGRESANSLQLPLKIDIGGFSFTPLHNFVDKSISKDYITTGKEKPDQRYISLGEDGKGYTFAQSLRKAANNVKVETQS